MAMKIPISFKESEKDLYEFLQGKMSPSIYIKEILRKEMGEKVIKKSSDKVTKRGLELDF